MFGTVFQRGSHPKQYPLTMKFMSLTWKHLGLDLRSRGVMASYTSHAEQQPGLTAR